MLPPGNPLGGASQVFSGLNATPLNIAAQSSAGVVKAGRRGAGQPEGTIGFAVGEESDVPGDSRAVKLQLDCAVELDADGIVLAVIPWGPRSFRPEVVLREIPIQGEKARFCKTERDKFALQQTMGEPDGTGFGLRGSPWRGLASFLSARPDLAACTRLGRVVPRPGSEDPRDER